MSPDVVVPMNFFDYEQWDKVTKPANFNMEIPNHLREEAKKRMHAAARRVHLDTPIYNGRQVQKELTLDTAGFCVETAPTDMQPKDFYDIQTMHTKYFPDCVDYVKRMTGATKVLPFDHSIRNKVLEGRGGISGYAGGCHNDNTVYSGPNRVRQLLKEGPEVEPALTYRYAVMNVWRRWDGGNDMPLAICSGDSLAPDFSDLVATDLVYKNRTGEIYSAVSNPNHTWFW
jgi:hypothetical protein